MKRISQKMINEFLLKNANIVPSSIPDDDENIYVTKSDGSYLTRVGMEDEIKYLIRLGITEKLQSNNGSTCCVGFNPEEQKWYGWSHRAIYGFGIGSKCERGDCHYTPVDMEDFIRESIRFWTEDSHKDVTAVQDGKEVRVSWTYSKDIPNKEMRGKITSTLMYPPDKWGSGEWVAETLDDAYKMAGDFANGVS